MTLILSGTDGLSDVDGSAATPAIRGTDANTGIFFPAADQVAITTGGTQRAVVDASGNVGIGTSSPGALLHVSNESAKVRVGLTATNQYTDIYRDNITGYTIYNAAQAATFRGHIWQLGGTEAARIDSAGNVGIGTSSPTSSGAGYTALHVNNATSGGQLHLTGGGSGAAATDGTILTQAGVELFINNQEAGSTLFYNNGSERARIDSSGNLLVGTTAPNGRLSVKTANPNTGGNWAARIDNASDDIMFGLIDAGQFYTGNGPSSPYNSTTGAAANLVVTSDAGRLLRSTSSLRYKTNVQDSTHGLAAVMALRPVTYKGKNDGDKVFGGLIAEEVDEAGLTEFVVYDSEGRPDALHYGNMVALAFKAIQELNAKVDAQAAEIAALKGAQ
jgi:hypothetical protein